MTVALPFIAAGASLLGGVAAVRGAQAQAALSRQEEQVQRRNVELAESDAVTYEDNVNLQIMQFRQGAGDTLSTLQTQLAKSGVDPGMGTGLWIAMETANRADDQVAQMQLEGLRGVRAIKEKGVESKVAEQSAGLQARQFARSVLPTFGASLLTGGGKFISTAAKYNKFGIS